MREQKRQKCITAQNPLLGWRENSIYYVLPGVPTSFRQELSKKSLNVTKGEKTRADLIPI